MRMRLTCVKISFGAIQRRNVNSTSLDFHRIIPVLEEISYIELIFNKFTTNIACIPPIANEEFCPLQSSKFIHLQTRSNNFFSFFNLSLTIQEILGL